MSWPSRTSGITSHSSAKTCSTSRRTGSIMAVLVRLWSAPRRVGSQISPRLGAGTVAMQVVLAERVKGGQFRVIPVAFLGQGGGRLDDRIPLRARKFPQLGRRPLSTQQRSVLVVHGDLSRPDSAVRRQHHCTSPWKEPPRRYARR